MELKRRDNESEYEYHKRLVLGKLVDGTLSDADYSELSELVYGRRYASDVARRMMYGSRKTIEMVDDIIFKSASNDNAIGNIDAKILELKKERYQLFDQRREFNKLLTSAGRLDHLFEVLEESVKNLPQLFIDTNKCDLDSYSDNSEAVLFLSDWHYGMTTNNVFNAYDTDECVKRVNTVVECCIERLNRHNVGKLHIVVLGDLIHGGVHVSTRVASEELICDQLIKVSELLAEAIARISQYTKSVVVHMTYGNHARVIARKEDSIHRDNLERIIPWWLNERFKDVDKVEIVTGYENELVYFESCGKLFCSTHGDLDSVKESPILLSTLFSKKYGKDIDYVVIGDKHHRESFEELGITSMICGSLCGTDDYANSKRLYSTPSQLLLIVNEKDGVDAEYRIKC